MSTGRITNDCVNAISVSEKGAVVSFHQLLSLARQPIHWYSRLSHPIAVALQSISPSVLSSLCAHSSPNNSSPYMPPQFPPAHPEKHPPLPHATPSPPPTAPIQYYFPIPLSLSSTSEPSLIIMRNGHGKVYWWETYCCGKTHDDKLCGDKGVGGSGKGEESILDVSVMEE